MQSVRQYSSFLSEVKTPEKAFQPFIMRVGLSTGPHRTGNSGQIDTAGLNHPEDKKRRRDQQPMTALQSSAYIPARMGEGLRGFC